MATDLRTQFLKYMTLQRFASHTKRSYVTGVTGLAKHYRQSPDTLTNDQIQDYLRYLMEERNLSWGRKRLFIRHRMLLQGFLQMG